MYRPPPASCCAAWPLSSNRSRTRSRSPSFGRRIVAWRSAALPAGGGVAPALSHVFVPGAPLASSSSGRAVSSDRARDGLRSAAKAVASDASAAPRESSSAHRFDGLGTGIDQVDVVAAADQAGAVGRSDRAGSDDRDFHGTPPEAPEVARSVHGITASARFPLTTLVFVGRSTPASRPSGSDHSD